MKPYVIIIGLLCITALALYALSIGINGIFLTMIIGLIAGAIGITMPTPKVLR